MLSSCENPFSEKDVLQNSKIATRPPPRTSGNDFSEKQIFWETAQRSLIFLFPKNQSSKSWKPYDGSFGFIFLRVRQPLPDFDFENIFFRSPLHVRRDVYTQRCFSRATMRVKVGRPLAAFCFMFLFCSTQAELPSSMRYLHCSTHSTKP